MPAAASVTLFGLDAKIDSIVLQATPTGGQTMLSAALVGVVTLPPYLGGVTVKNDVGHPANFVFAPGVSAQLRDPGTWTISQQSFVGLGGFSINVSKTTISQDGLHLEADAAMPRYLGGATCFHIDASHTFTKVGPPPGGDPSFTFNPNANARCFFAIPLGGNGAYALEITHFKADFGTPQPSYTATANLTLPKVFYRFSSAAGFETFDLALQDGTFTFSSQTLQYHVTTGRLTLNATNPTFTASKDEMTFLADLDADVSLPGLPTASVAYKNAGLKADLTQKPPTVRAVGQVDTGTTVAENEKNAAWYAASALVGYLLHIKI